MLPLLTLLHCIFSHETMVRLPSSHQRTTLPPVTCILWTHLSSILGRRLLIFIGLCVQIPNFKVPKIQHTVFIFYCCCWACLLYDAPDVRLHVTVHIFPVITLLQLAKICCCGKSDLATVR